MAKFTKQVICASFFKLLNARSLDQITVKDIVEDCGINRKTFYYYFQDIRALMGECFKSELQRIKAELPENVSWQEAQKALAHAMLENRTALLHVYRAMDYADVEQVAYEIVMKPVLRIMSAQAGERDIAPSDILLIAELYASSIAVVFARWVRGGMTGDLDAMIDRTSAIMKGTQEFALANAEKLKR